MKCLSCYEPLEGDGEYHSKCLKALFGSARLPELDLSESFLEDAARRFLEKGIAVTGVQKKLSLHLKSNEERSPRLTVVGALGGHFILKPQTTEWPELPENEDLTMHLARLCRMRVAQHSLIRLSDGHLAYLTKRFDRKEQRKLAMEDMCQLSGKQTEQKYKGSHEEVGRLIQKHTAMPGEHLLRFFEQTVFCFLTGNADMHLKNTSLLEDDRGRFGLAPAYDLVSTTLVIPEKENPEECALALNGRKSKLRRKDFLELGEKLSIPDKVTERTLKNFMNFVPKMEKLIEKSFLSEPRRQEYVDLIRRRAARL